MQKRILIIDYKADISELVKIVFRDSRHNVIFSHLGLNTEYLRMLKQIVKMNKIDQILHAIEMA